jgi:hypothetical protein
VVKLVETDNNGGPTPVSPGGIDNSDSGINVGSLGKMKAKDVVGGGKSRNGRNFPKN